MDQYPDKFGHECKVGLPDDPYVLQHRICTLTIHINVLGYLPFGGLSHPQITLKMALLNKVQAIVKLRGKELPGSICVSAI